MSGFHFIGGGVLPILDEEQFLFIQVNSYVDCSSVI